MVSRAGVDRARRWCRCATSDAHRLLPPDEASAAQALPSRARRSAHADLRCRERVGVDQRLVRLGVEVAALAQLRRGTRGFGSLLVYAPSVVIPSREAMLEDAHPRRDVAHRLAGIVTLRVGHETPRERMPFDHRVAVVPARCLALLPDPALDRAFHRPFEPGAALLQFVLRDRREKVPMQAPARGRTVDVARAEYTTPLPCPTSSPTCRASAADRAQPARGTRTTIPEKRPERTPSIASRKIRALGVVTLAI